MRDPVRCMSRHSLLGIFVVFHMRCDGFKHGIESVVVTETTCDESNDSFLGNEIGPLHMRLHIDIQRAQLEWAMLGILNVRICHVSSMNLNGNCGPCTANHLSGGIGSFP